MSYQFVARSKAQRLLLAILIGVLILFAIFQFVYIAGVVLGTAATIILGFVAVIKEISLFESFVSAAGCVFFLLMMAIAMLVRNATIKAVSFNVGFLFLAICIFETYLFQHKKNDSTTIALNNVVVNVPSNFWAANKYLGVVPAPDNAYRVTSTYGKDVLYNVTYTIDKHSHRLSPPYLCGADGESLVFFGCSITFGYGLEDKETFPYLVGNKLSNQYKIYNFSFGGYGTHHMLSQIEHGLVEKVVEVKPKYVIYTAIPDHLRRIAGDTPWGAKDPKYTLEDGKAVYKGLFYENASIIGSIGEKIQHSHTASTLFGGIIENNRVELFTAMVEASRDKMEILYPGSEFVVLFWEDYAQLSLSNKMMTSLRDKGFQVHPISNVIPDYFKNFKKYQIRFPMEQHPNLLANEYVSDYIAKKVIKTSH